MGCHGASIFMAHEDIHLQGELLSDCACLKEKAMKAMAYDSLRILLIQPEAVSRPHALN